MQGNALFVGHSLVGPVMPVMFNAFLADQGLDQRADAQVINGAPLHWNWGNGASAEGVNARAVLPSGEYGAVIVTAGVPLAGISLADQFLWSETNEYAQRYFDLAIASNPQTQFYVYETWTRMGEDTGAWRAEITANLGLWEGIIDHINANALDGAPEALIVPAGQAMGNLHDAIEAGRVPGMSSIRDLFTDDIHLSEIGHWFIAALQAEVVAGIDAATAPRATSSIYGDPFDMPDAALAAAFNDVIDQTLSVYQHDGVGGDGTLAPIPDVPDDTNVVPEEDDPVPVVPDDEAPSVTGNDRANTLLGDTGNDQMFGYGGNDTLTGGAGDDVLDGGTGWDSALYAADQDNFTLTLRAAGLEVTDRRAAGDGTDQLIDIEALEFFPPDQEGQGTYLDLFKVGGTLGLSAAQLESFVELYIAYFNRAPDAVGLNFWGTAHANGISLQQIAAEFVVQGETRAAYPEGMSNAEIVAAVYDNVLGRVGDADGVAFWLDVLDRGAVAQDQFILAVLEGAKAAPPPGASAAFVAQQNADRAYLADKTDIGAYFSVHLGMTDVTDAAEAMALFDGTQTGLNNAVDLIRDLHQQIEQGDANSFLMPVVGVLDLPDWA